MNGKEKGEGARKKVETGLEEVKEREKKVQKRGEERNKKGG